MYVIAAPPGSAGEEGPRALARLLGRFCKTGVCFSDGIFAPPDSLFIVICRSFDHVAGSGCVLWLCEGAQPPREIGEEITAVTCGAPVPAAGRLISCGLGARDTMTVSSLTAGRAVASLLRPVQTVAGEMLEPFEISLKLPEWADVSTALSAAAILILCGITPTEFDFGI